MRQRIRKTSRILQTEFYLFLILAAATFLAYESGILEEGIYAGDPRMSYIWSTTSILSTLALVPLSLKLYSFMMKRQVDKANLTHALKLYKKWNEIRLLMLAASTFFNIYVYYATLENMGALCALINITASVFCLPSESKLKSELNINEDTEL